MNTVSVIIPTIMRSFTGGEVEVKVCGNTLREVITDLNTTYAGIARQILDDSGEIRRFVNVYIGETDVRYTEGLDTVVASGARVAIIPAVAGG
jgi:molybdopterin converting factor small subunit